MMRVLIYGIALLGLVACSSPLQIGGIDVVLGEDDIALKRGTETITRLQKIKIARFEPEVTMLWGFFDFQQSDRSLVDLDLRRNGNAFDLLDGSDVVGTLELAPTAANNLGIDVKLDPEAVSFDSIIVEFECAADDRFWGFGEQYNRIDQRGHTLPMWTQEQGVGRANTSTPPVGSFENSYFPMPMFLDPQKGYGMSLDARTYSEFDVCNTDPEIWRAEIWDRDQVRLSFFASDDPGTLVRKFANETAKPASLPPEWAFDGVWIAAQGGTTSVTQRLQQAQEAQIPVRAVWVQDWVGLRHFGGDNFGVKYRWVHDQNLYPDLAQSIADWADDGIRFLGYFNPFVVPDYDLYPIAEDKGYMIKTPDNAVYDFNIITFPGSLVDITNDRAKNWFQDFARTALDMGMKGWMADFGEWVPYDAVLAAGSGAQWHNDYPRLWHQANREVLEEQYPDGDFVMLTRSGFTGDHEAAQIVWAGDQEADWSEGDGIGTVIAAGLTIGMGAIPYFTHDIAGFSGGPSDQELFARWTELGAFSPVMRTHDGLRKKENIYFGSNTEVTNHFRYFAKVHEAFAPYIMEWARYAQQSGEPILRHTAFVAPDWEAAYDVHTQWFVGEDVVFAPVVRPGQNSATVALPEGSWEHVFTGDIWAGPNTLTVDAPVGTPAVFRRISAYDGRVTAATETLDQIVENIRAIE